MGLAILPHGQLGPAMMLAPATFSFLNPEP
jgi:hypothetical protein